VVFRQALQALGWTEGRNVQFIYRWSAGDVMRARPFAKELLDLRSDVILANTTPVAVAVRDTTRTTPTVFVQVSDPVAAGVVQSLARPGGNLTGFTNFEPSIASKWLELLKGVAPNITRVAYLFNPNTAPLFYARAVETAAPLLSVKPFDAAVHNADEMERVIAEGVQERPRALVPSDGLEQGRQSPGAPKGNKNAFKHGHYTAEAIATRREIAKLLRDARALVQQVS
jgi:putative ABC transport system substrate-binding protein